MAGQIRVQTVCHSDRISEGNFSKKLICFKKNQRTTKKHEKFPRVQRVKGFILLELLISNQSNGVISCANAK